MKGQAGSNRRKKDSERLMVKLGELLKILACPMCGHGGLGWSNGSGWLFCSGCGRHFPIEEGIPCLLPDSLMGARIEPWDGSWFKRRREVDRQVLDDDRRTYREAFSRLAQQEGIEHDKDRFLWERMLYEEVPLLRESIREEVRSRWVVTREGLASRNARILQALHRIEGELTGKLLLNVGPGTDGDLIDRLQEGGAEVVNCDIVIDSLKEIRKEGDREGVCGDLLALLFDSGAFDMVLCVQVIHHAHPVQGAFSSMVRVLKQGGKAVVVELNPKSPAALPGRLLPSALKRPLRRLVRQQVLGSKERFFKGSPYEELLPSKEIRKAFSETGFEGVGRVSISYAPAFLPSPLLRLWEWGGRRLRWLFDPVALEYLYWGRKR